MTTPNPENPEPTPPAGESTDEPGESLEEFLAILEADPLASPMKPGHPGWLEPGESVVTFIKHKQKPAS